jgi:hypothetical protein
MYETQPLINKQMIIVASSIVFGATVHTLNEIKKVGWKGWINFFSETAMSIFAGWVFYNISQIFYPQYVIIMCSLGSFWGVTTFKYLRDWFLNSLKANLK